MTTSTVAPTTPPQPGIRIGPLVMLALVTFAATRHRPAPSLA